MGIELCNLNPCCTMHRHGMEKTLQGHQNKMNKELQLQACARVKTIMMTQSAETLTFLLLWTVAYICR